MIICVFHFNMSATIPTTLYSLYSEALPFIEHLFTLYILFLLWTYFFNIRYTECTQYHLIIYTDWWGQQMCDMPRQHQRICRHSNYQQSNLYRWEAGYLTSPVTTPKTFLYNFYKKDGYQTMKLLPIFHFW